MTNGYEVRNGQLFLDGEDLRIRRPIVQAGLAAFASRTGRSFWSEKGRRLLPREAADEVLSLERRSSLALLAMSIEDAVSPA